MLENKFINGSTLKVLAIVTMLIDHMAAGLLYYIYRSDLLPSSIDTDQFLTLYHWLRHIGRFAFPVYCFLLVEGFHYTHDRVKYARNLFIFALLSELPFDFTLYADYSTPGINIAEVYSASKAAILSNCNVMFTLFTSLLVIWAIETIRIRLASRDDAASFVLQALVVALGCLLVHVLGTDYSYTGIIVVVVMYLFRDNRLYACLLGYLVLSCLWSEYYSFPAFILLYLYNGKQGRISKKHKYFFYAFYPVHLICIFLIRGLIVSKLSF